MAKLRTEVTGSVPVLDEQGDPRTVNVHTTFVEGATPGKWLQPRHLHRLETGSEVRALSNGTFMERKTGLKFRTIKLPDK